MLDVLIDNSRKQRSSGRGISISDRSDKPVKSIIKAVSWRVIGTVDTMLISYILTGKATIALSIGSIEVLSKTILYYFHERLWAHIHNLRFQVLIRKNVRRFKFKRYSKPPLKKVSRRIPQDTCATIYG
jgi:uncharacterized membrane protein